MAAAPCAQPPSVACSTRPSSTNLRGGNCTVRPRRARAAALRASAAADTAQAAGGSDARAATPLLALKEWAPTCAALAAGEQTILLRKGGIKEPTFVPAARDFLLFPTGFHTDAELLKPAAAQRYTAEAQYDPKAQSLLAFATQATVTGAWTTFDPTVLHLLDELHVWAPGFLEQRLKWRAKQPITVLELRAARLQPPLVLPPEEGFFGCFSWLDLTSAAAAAVAAGQQQAAAAAAAGRGAELALGEDEFAARQAVCRRQLAKLADLEELRF